jgi:hypothetical protein
MTSPETLASAAEAATIPAPSRAEINRQNSQHSTGPRTAEGKARVSQNALKTGFYARSVFLAGEDRIAYDELGAMLLGFYNPQDERELDLTRDLQNAMWLRNRATALEINCLTVATDQKLPEVAEEHADKDEMTQRAIAQSLAFFEKSKELDQLGRQVARQIRQIDKIRNHLLAMIQFRLSRVAAVETEDQAEDLERRADAGNSEQPTAAESGFVPSNFTTEESEPATRAKRTAMPKFSGPNRNQARKNWLRAQAKAAQRVAVR